MFARCSPVTITDHELVIVLYFRDDVVNRRMIVLSHVQCSIGALDRVVEVSRWIIFPIAVEADGQLALRVVFAEQDIRYSSSTLLARIPGMKKCRDFVEPAPRVRTAAADQGDNCVWIG